MDTNRLILIVIIVMVGVLIWMYSLSSRRDTQSDDRADNASGDGSGYASTGSTYGIANTVVADG